MAATTPHTILLETNDEDLGARRTRNALSGGSILPGHLLEWTTGNLTGVATAGKSVQKMFALEAPWATGSPTIDQAYASGQTVNYIIAQPGDEVYAVLATGNNVAANAPLGASATAGQLAALTVDAAAVLGALVGYAVEAVNATAAAARVKVRIAG